MSDNMLRIAGVQMDVVLGAASANVAAMLQHLRTAVGQGAKLIAFPECCVTGYCFDSLAEALTMSEALDGPSCQAISDACREANVCAIFGMLERDGDAVFNTAVLARPGGQRVAYRKTHLPHLGVDRYTTCGAHPYEVTELPELDGLRVGMNICYDAAFPEPTRALALAGADLVVLPTNWPPGAETMAEHVMNTRALENHIYFMAVNRIGQERGFRFIGGSRICSPSGETMSLAPAADAMIMYADISPALARDKHIVRVPQLHEISRFADRRPELYGPIVKPRSDVS